MKTLTLFSVLTLLTFYSNAQKCHRAGDFIGAGDVDVSGSVSLELQDDGSIQLQLSSDFKSDSGPDLDIYLGSSGRVNTFSVRVEALSSLAGSQVYTISSAINLEDYDYVTIHCTHYSHYYGSALLGAKTGDCTALKVNEAIVPSAFRFDINLSGIAVNSDKQYSDVMINVYDFSGRLSYSKLINSVEKGSSFIAAKLPLMGVVGLRTGEWFLSRKYILK